MENLNKILLVGFITCWFINPCFSQTDTAKIANKSPFSFSASYKGEIVTNYFGGIKPGTDYLGLANLTMGFDTQKAKLWKNGFLFINAANSHGSVPSANLVGDFQSISNIQAGNHAFLYQLWYKQSFQNIAFIIGLQDVSTLFAVNDYGNYFVNSSFTLPSSFLDNIPVSIYPHTALGVIVKWNIAPDYVWQNALFDGKPDNFETSPYNINWKLPGKDGITLISELKVARSLIPGMNGIYKVGAYYNEHNQAIGAIKKNYGYYLIASQQLSKKENDSIGLSLFSQIGLCPRDKNINNQYFSLGLTYKGPFNKRPGDEAGIAFAYAGFNQKVVSYETAIELYYRLKISNNFLIKPDVQYIINPAGTDRMLANALVSLIRFELSF